MTQWPLTGYPATPFLGFSHSRSFFFSLVGSELVKLYHPFIVDLPIKNGGYSPSFNRDQLNQQFFVGLDVVLYFCHEFMARKNEDHRDWDCWNIPINQIFFRWIPHFSSINIWCDLISDVPRFSRWVSDMFQYTICDMWIYVICSSILMIFSN